MRRGEGHEVGRRVKKEGKTCRRPIFRWVLADSSVTSGWWRRVAWRVLADASEAPLGGSKCRVRGGRSRFKKKEKKERSAHFK